MAPSEPTEQDLRILVVSDDPIVREQARFGFPSGAVVSFAVDAREAWQLLQRDDFSAVVADMQTGSAGGFGLTRDMAESERLARIPVLILLEREQDAWLARKAGATSYHTKPMTAVGLVGEVLAVARHTA